MEKSPQMSEVNIMLLGMTGSGKSASGNTIIGGDEKKFKELFSPSSVTKVCKTVNTVVNGQMITVIDTVGLSDTGVKIKDAHSQIENVLQCINLDVFLLVIKLGETFTDERRKAVKWIQENFGAKVLKHTIVLFTYGDALKVPIETYLSKCETLWSVVDRCRGGYHVFNNKDGERSQVTELLKKINTLRVKNKYSRYTEQYYEKAQEALRYKNWATGPGVAEIGAAALIGATGGAALLAIGVGLGVLFFGKNI